MPRRCQITGKRPLRARNISHAHNVTNRFQKPNIQRKRIYVPELGRFIRLKVSTRAMRTITKLGLARFLKKQGLTLKDIT
ncbi:MAG: 50S ribosomal protein L28 [Acidobacteriota bacterium]|nr:50S ribosomal protein L28 [Acidobacteriota bacterium]